MELDPDWVFKFALEDQLWFVPFICLLFLLLCPFILKQIQVISLTIRFKIFRDYSRKFQKFEAWTSAIISHF